MQNTSQKGGEDIQTDISVDSKTEEKVGQGVPPVIDEKIENMHNYSLHFLG